MASFSKVKLMKRKGSAGKEDGEVESKQQLLSGQRSSSEESGSQGFGFSESSSNPETVLNSSNFPPPRTCQWNSTADYFNAMGLGFRVIWETEDELDYFVRRHVYEAIGKLHPAENPHADNFFTIQSSSSGKEIEENVRAIFDTISLNIPELKKCATDINVFKRVFRQIEIMEKAMDQWYIQFNNPDFGDHDGRMLNSLTLTRSKVNLETKAFFRKFIVNGKNFTNKLKKMVCHMNKKEQSPFEVEYRILFSFFLNMFSLETSVCPDVDCKELTITGYERNKDAVQCCLLSTPDILISQMDFKKKEDQILAVVMAEREYSKDEILVHQRSKSQERSSQVTHVESKTVGQHTGDLLVHMPCSVFSGHGIMGMILQATEVSFTFLCPGTDYLQYLQNGFCNGRRQAVLNISMHADFLTVEGREKLIGPLLKLFFLQKCFSPSNTSI